MCVGMWGWSRESEGRVTGESDRGEIRDGRGWMI